MNSKWEFTNLEEMLNLTTGKFPYATIDEGIKSVFQDRLIKAEMLKDKLQLHKEMIGLEIGSGPGFYAFYLSDHLKKLYCCDISSAYLKFAKKICIEKSNLEFKLINTFKFDFLADASLDFCFSTSVFIHLNYYDVFWYLNELKRVLKLGAIFYFDIVTMENIISYHQIKFKEMAISYRDNPSSEKNLLNYLSKDAIGILSQKCGFEVVEMQDLEGLFKTCIILRKVS